MRKSSITWRWTSALCLALLAAVAIDAWRMPKPADAREYHRRIAASAAQIPPRTADGRWIGHDVPVAPGAVKMLSPNAILSRHYVNTASGAEVSLLLVQCGDARDMTAHYPPVCMVNSGWTLEGVRVRNLHADALLITVSEYTFSKRSFDASSSIVIDDFMILPSGEFVPDMDAVTRAASQVEHRYFGAAQIQVLTDARLPEAERDAAFVDLVGTMRQTIKDIRSGGSQ